VSLRSESYVGREKREYRVDELKLRRLRLALGLTIEKFWMEAIIDSGTAKKMFRGGPVGLTTIAKAAKLLGITDHLELLHPDELRDLGVDPAVTIPSNSVLEWEIESFISPWEQTANGLQFHLAKLRHRYFEKQFARGKCYELRHLAPDDRTRLKEHLRRHPDVCKSIRNHPNIAKNITATFVEKGGLWWVLDEYEEGARLAERLADGPLEPYALKNVMAGIAAGLIGLHKEKIIRRELSPRFVILRPKNLVPVLTDFELAKLLDGKPTVAPKGGWPDDPYRAIEVTGEGTIDERADVYSWGRIFVEAAIGTLPVKGQEAAMVEPLPLPDAVKDYVLRCVSLARSDRPDSLEGVGKVLKRWSPRP
jgi:serine/threonine protein kinase